MSETSDPFAPPVEPARPTQVDALSAPQAERVARFGAALVDRLAVVCLGLVGVGISAIGALAAGTEDQQVLNQIIGVGALVAASPLSVYQWYYEATEGTTIGKRQFDIRVVCIDGSPMNFLTGVVLRRWIIGAAVLAFGPLGNMLSLCDAAAIFTADHRTLHDYLAGTRVVKVRRPRPPAPEVAVSGV